MINILMGVVATSVSGGPTISGTLPGATVGQPYDQSLVVNPPGTAVTLRSGDITGLAAHNITHDGFGRFTSPGVTL